MDVHRGINFSRLEVPADAGGVIFTVGSVAVLLLGLRPVRWFFVAALAVGLAKAALTAAWHRRATQRAWPVTLGLGKGRTPRA